MEAIIHEVLVTVGFPAVIVLGVGLWLRRHLDGLMEASLAREGLAAQDRKLLGARITSLEDRQFSEVTQIIKDSQENARQNAAALNALATAVRRAPCGKDLDTSEFAEKRMAR